ncbi:DgaE family pyridoxal phosphate-dependent ammonia lyase [Gracilibacillus caseinilyticus]|uniref:DgaE family pyridoxal phosphate-dependent ammonia lyase n=1 Tax=Gracilibacillus caseinilyticus TaxID=2932256 RepID=A0ABY4EQU2_9BACI|nr:DgaE family pyridoxal phosphate-dependent ammonia lyase [Gracilibacillus caseinilyticus]UOQ46725.1 DgaE family pyridoxal phosphate-dependent ammonia lyase [Gracilibacillus caseinilyticus]
MASSLHAKYGLKRVINASGRMSILGVSAPEDSVMEAMKTGAQSYVEMADLVNKAGSYIASKLGSEDAVIVNSASSGIAIAIAGLVTKGNTRTSMKLHQLPIEKNEVILFKGHNVQYGAPIETMIHLGSGKVIEVGYANEGKQEHIKEAINPNTAAIIYVQSHHAVQKNIISVEEAYTIAEKHHIPFVIDAAAEGDLTKYPAISDLVIYSGSKAIEGPTSGIIAGKKEYVDWAKVQLSGIGRSMKVGKEASFGLLQALDIFFDKKDTSHTERESLTVLQRLVNIDGVNVQIIQDEAGRNIYRARITIDSSATGQTAEEIVHQLKSGEIAIYTRDYGASQGFLDIDPRPLQKDDLDIIYDRFCDILGGNHS